jgi:hypothetical protein
MYTSGRGVSHSDTIFSELEVSYFSAMSAPSKPQGKIVQCQNGEVKLLRDMSISWQLKVNISQQT